MSRRPGSPPRAAQYAYRLLPLEEFTGKAWPHRHVTSSLARNVDAAAVAMTAARDLLHTHFRTTADGIRQDCPEWAHMVTSAPVQKPCWATSPRGHVTSSATAAA